MNNFKTQAQMFNNISKNLRTAGLEGWFKVTGYADYCFQVGIKVEDIHGFREVEEHYKEDVVKLNNGEKGGYYIFDTIWSESYIKGEVPSGWNVIKLPKSPEYDELRNRILSIKEKIETAGYKVNGISEVYYFDYVEDGKNKFAPALCFRLQSKELNEWRDQQYKANFYDGMMECEEDRRREMEYAEYRFCH